MCVCVKHSWADIPQNLNSSFNYQLRTRQGKCQMAGYSWCSPFYGHSKYASSKCWDLLKLTLLLWRSYLPHKGFIMFTYLRLFWVNTCKLINWSTKTAVLKPAGVRNRQWNPSLHLIKGLIELLLYQFYSLSETILERFPKNKVELVTYSGLKDTAKISPGKLFISILIREGSDFISEMWVACKEVYGPSITIPGTHMHYVQD